MITTGIGQLFVIFKSTKDISDRWKINYFVYPSIAKMAKDLCVSDSKKFILELTA